MTTRIYTKKHITNVRVPVIVLEEFWVKNKGATNIPHRIAEAVGRSVDILEIALARMTEENYMNPADDISRIHYMVFRHEELRSACKTVHSNPKSKDKQVEAAQTEIKKAFLGPDRKSGSSAMGSIAKIREQLNTILDGLKTPTLIVKVNDKLRAHSQHGGHFSGEDLPTHYRGLVKSWHEFVGSKKVKRYGNIEVGFESFRTDLYIPRIILHEAAHKFCDCYDGEHKYEGYWKSNYSDYLEPNGLSTTDNADSMAVFAWALAQRQINVNVPGLFATTMGARWNH